MPFLRVNGVTIPVADRNSAMEIADVAEPQRAFSGAQRSARSSQKRKWTFETPPLTAADAATVEGLISGQGECFAFDGDTYSKRGLGPSTFASLIYEGVASDGRNVAGLSRFSKGVAVCPITTNLLTANQRSVESNTSGFTAVDGAALAQNFVYAAHGLASLYVTPSTTPNGVRGGALVNATTATTTATHCASCYVMAPTATTVRFQIQNTSTGAVGAIVTATLTPFVWQRLRGTSVAATTGNLLTITILEDTPDAGVPFCVDALQLEARASPAAFVDGTLASYGLLRYAYAPTPRPDALTISFWTGSDMPTGQHTIWQWTAASGGTPDRFTISSLINDLKIEQISNGVSTAYTIPNVFAAPYWGVLRHFMLVVRRSYGGTIHTFELYVDGASVWSANLSTLVSFANLTVMDVGSSGGAPGSQHYWAIDELAVLPFALPASAALAWAQATVPYATLPILVAEGDFAPGEVVACAGVLADQGVSGAFLGGWKSNARRVRFSLEEI